MKRKGSKYILAGIVSWAADYGGLLLLYYPGGLPLGVATTVAFIFGLSVNFALMKYWVFARSRRGKQAVLSQGAQYIALSLFNLLITNVVIYALSKHGIGPEISKILTTAMIVCWNFLIYRRVMFKERI